MLTSGPMHGEATGPGAALRGSACSIQLHPSGSISPCLRLLPHQHHAANALPDSFLCCQRARGCSAVCMRDGARQQLFLYK